MFSYSKFEGLTTPWLWLDALLCRVFGHPGRSYFFGENLEDEQCARCVKARKKKKSPLAGG